MRHDSRDRCYILSHVCDMTDSYTATTTSAPWYWARSSAHYNATNLLHVRCDRPLHSFRDTTQCACVCVCVSVAVSVPVSVCVCVYLAVYVCVRVQKTRAS